MIMAALVVAAIFLILFGGEKEQGKEVVLYCDRMEIGRYSLFMDNRITVPLDNGYNTVVIEHGMVYVEEADCDNQICVETAPVKNAGETIVCLPHRFYLSIE